MTTRRWYPTLETLEDGSIIIVGGCDYGGYVNDAGQNNPTFEYWPSRGAPIGLNLLCVRPGSLRLLTIADPERTASLPFLRTFSLSSGCYRAATSSSMPSAFAPCTALMRRRH